MSNENTIESIKKASYYCQSCYTSMELFNDLVENRKLELLNPLLAKIIEDISNLIRFYSNINSQDLLISDMNSKLEIFLDGYENLDYYYIKDIFSYEMIPVVENIFNEIKRNISVQQNYN